jgi:hypothetical protein
MTLTSPFNLPAPGRRQPLYVVLDFAETCVFVKQSPDALRCDPEPFGQGTPSPEVTEPICLVPEQTITRAPENTHLDHLCRFVVRIPCPPSGFSWQSKERICLSPFPFSLVRLQPSPGITVCVPASDFAGQR